MTKTYWALVDGEVPLDAGGTIIEPVDGRPAKSDWEVVETFVGDRWKYALVRVNPRTGRTASNTRPHGFRRLSTDGRHVVQKRSRKSTECKRTQVRSRLPVRW